MIFNNSMHTFLQEGLPNGHGSIQSGLFMGLSIICKESFHKITELKAMANVACEYNTILFPVNESLKLPLIIIRLAKNDDYIYRITIDLNNPGFVEQINNPDNSRFHNFILIDQDMTDLTKMFNVRYKGEVLFQSLQYLHQNNPSLTHDEYYNGVKEMNQRFPHNLSLLNHVSSLD